jgi:hypothetical protein
LRLADVLAVDLNLVVRKKLVVNQDRFPILGESLD